MSKLKKHFSKLAAEIEGNFDAVALALRKRLHSNDPLQIVTYRSYGTVNRLYIKGRVLKKKQFLNHLKGFNLEKSREHV
jgi:hypothetical protein